MFSSLMTQLGNNRMSLAAQPQPTQQQTQVMSNNNASRRSYVVKEVERLKENREKRRARQLEIREEKTALMNSDPGNPNWELAAMIRLVSFSHSKISINNFLILFPGNTNRRSTFVPLSTVKQQKIIRLQFAFENVHFRERRS